MPGAERQHDHDAGVVAPGPVADLGQAGGVGVVDDVDLLAGRLGEQGVGVGADPRRVDVGRAVDHALADDARERHAQRGRSTRSARPARRRPRPCAPGVAGFGVRILYRSAVSSPVARSTGAAFIPDPPMSMPNDCSRSCGGTVPSARQPGDRRCRPSRGVRTVRRPAPGRRARPPAPACATVARRVARIDGARHGPARTSRCRRTEPGSARTAARRPGRRRRRRCGT